MITIEHGVPIPPRHRGGKRREFSKVFAQMRKGDSAFFPGLDSHNLWVAGLGAFGSGNFTVRKMDGGARIWRI